MAILVERITQFKEGDLGDLCGATEDAIKDGIGFNWLTPPPSEVLENYWKGVLMVPERVLFGGRLDGALAASVQLIKPSKHKQAAAFMGTLEAHFVTPWARGHGLAKALLQAAEEEALNCNLSLLTLHVRETQQAAIHLYEENGYIRWGILPYYEQVNGQMIAGHYFYKQLKKPSGVSA